MSRVLWCAACTRRIKPHHPHIGLIDLETGKELVSYHARCQEAAMQDIPALFESGKPYALRHFHSAACPDKSPGFGCSGGCFDSSAAAVAN